MASVFYLQHKREQQATAEAKFHLQQAHRTVDRFNSLVSRHLNSVPGSDELRSEMVEASTGYYREFLNHANENGGFEFESAQAHGQLAAIHEREGDYDRARKEYETSIKKLSRLSGDEAQRELAISMNLLGLVLYRDGDLGGSSSLLKRSQEKFESLEDPGKANIPHSELLANLAMLDEAGGNIQQAVWHYEAALELNSGTSDEAITSQAKISNGFAALLSSTDSRRAIQFLEKGIETLEDALSSHRGKTSSFNVANENGKHLADMRNNLAVLLSLESKTERAKKLCRKSIDFWLQQQKRYPYSVTTLDALATSLNALGEIGWRSGAADLGGGEFEQAEKVFRRALKIKARPETQSRLAGVLHNKLSLIHI